MMRVGFDTNILAYLVGVTRAAPDAAKVTEVRRQVGALAMGCELFAPVQAFGELFVVLRRSGASATEAREVVLGLLPAFATGPSDMGAMLAATDLAVDHRLQLWDALIVSAAANAGCVLLLSEDMHSGFITRGMMVTNPLVTPHHPKLALALRN